MIPIKDLTLGYADAENYKRRENKELLNKVFIRDNHLSRLCEPNISFLVGEKGTGKTAYGFAPIFPDTCYHLTHYWLAAVDIPVASDNPVHYADAIRYNARTPLQGSLLPLTRLVWA